MILDAARIVLGYLLGSVSGSLLLGRLRGIDIRTQGSGNAGGTNAFRTQGLWFALGVAVIDVGKSALAAWIGGCGIADGGHALRVALLAGAAAVPATSGRCITAFAEARGWRRCSGCCWCSGPPGWR